MNKMRKIEVDEKTAEVLEARAAARGLGVAELLADLVDNEEALPPELAKLRLLGQGAWSPEVLAEDARRVAEFERTREGVPWVEIKAWMQTWGTGNEGPPPKPRKL
jgi:hypothetical protein